MSLILSLRETKSLYLYNEKMCRSKMLLWCCLLLSFPECLMSRRPWWAPYDKAVSNITIYYMSIFPICASSISIYRHSPWPHKPLSLCLSTWCLIPDYANLWVRWYFFCLVQELRPASSCKRNLAWLNYHDKEMSKRTVPWLIWERVAL